MKKFLSLCAAILFAFAANAAVINISSATPDALRTALNSAATGDVIEMAAGTYVESNSNYIAFAGKNVTVRAAEGAEVIIQPQVPITLAEGAVARFENVKFDVSRLMELATWYEHLIYPSDANEDNKLELEGCEFYGFNINKSMIYCSTSNRLASVTINNCYFHNIMKSILFVENTTAMNVQIKNSTFANISTDAESYWAGPIDVRATGSSYLVDHCTFYNVLPMNTDYSATGKITITDGVVSNCIFMLPGSTDGVRAIRGVAQANNCLVYNYLYDSGWGIHSSVTKSNCINGQDPLFVDAANGDFHLGEGSPALGAGTDESNLGDPRWWPASAPVDPRPAVPDTQLNIFASGLQVSAVEDDKATVSYVLNAVATDVEVQLLDVDGVVIKTYPAPYSAYNKGANSFEIDLSDVADGTYHWAVKATSNATTTLANVITNYTDGIYNYYLPQGLAIDNNPENPYFGRIYVSESTDGANDGATARTKAMTRGIFIYDALLNDVTSQGTTGYLGGLTDMTASDRTAFKRIVVDKDGYVYINSMDATRGGVYRMDPANPSADFVPVLDLAQKGTTYTTISSMAVEGQGAEKVLYTADNFVASATTGSINKYAIGNATNYAQQPDTFVTVSGDNDLGISDNQFVSDGRGGFWGCQHRWGYDTWAAVYHLTAAGVRDYVIQSGTNTDVLPQSSDVTTYRGVIAINESKTLLAIPTKSRVVVYNIAYDEETGVPTLTEAYRTGNIFGNNIDGLAFDYAENLYVLSASKEMFYAYATVKPNNSCVTPAPTTSTITLGTPVDDTYFAYTVTETIAKNTETAATGGTIIFGADKFEIMSGTELFGYKLDGNPSETNSKYVLCKLNRPLAAGDVISITGFASSNPKDGQAFQVSLDRAGSQVVGSAATTVAKAIETLDIHINTIGVGATEFYITRVSQSVYFTAVKVHADEGPATGFDNLNEAPKAEKFFMNGQVYIRRDGAVYTITGVRVK